MGKSWSDADGQLLKELREQAGLAPAVFAKRHALSTSHLKELEGGGIGSFYSDDIKAHTGRKLLGALGYEFPQEPESLAPTQAPAEPGEFPPAPALSTEPPRAVDPIAAAPEIVPAASLPTPPRWSRQPGAGSAPGRVSTWPLVMLLLVATVGIVWATAAGKSPRTSPTPPPSPPRIATSTPEVQTPPATLSVAEATPNPEMKTLAAAQVANPSPTACEPAPELQLTRYQSPSTSRPDTYVYLESINDVQVCVIDSQNQPTLVTLKAGQSINVTGVAPFVIRTTDWSHLKAFFQGQRVQLDAGVPTSNVVLQPRRGA